MEHLTAILLSIGLTLSILWILKEVIPILITAPTLRDHNHYEVDGQPLKDW